MSRVAKAAPTPGVGSGRLVAGAGCWRWFLAPVPGAIVTGSRGGPAWREWPQARGMLTCGAEVARQSVAPTRMNRWVILAGYALLTACTQLLWLAYAPITTQTHQ